MVFFYFVAILLHLILQHYHRVWLQVEAELLLGRSIHQLHIQLTLIDIENHALTIVNIHLWLLNTGSITLELHAVAVVILS